MEGHDEPRNLDDFASVSRGISRAGPQNLATNQPTCGKPWALIISLLESEQDWIGLDFTSPPTQYRLYGRRLEPEHAAAYYKSV